MGFKRFINEMKRYYLFFLIVVMISSCSLMSKEKSIRQKSVFSSHFFPDEIKPELNKPCFQGAYYRKLVSSKDSWLGINGRVVLPEIQFDPQRVHPKKIGQYLDNPSIYLGGLMDGQETDIGLAWEVIREKDGSISAERKAYRPFLRRTGHASGQKPIFENAPADARYYWYPGEEIYISLKIISPKKIKFVVEGAGKKFERDFECDGYDLSGLAEFKRVNAIDQVANEGKPVQPTQTKVLNAIWKQTNLYRMVSGQVEEVPFHKGRYTEMLCPAVNHFKITASKKQLKLGAEIINISGNGF